MQFLSRLFPKFHLLPLPADFFHGVVDIHSHILPGVDDGIDNAEAAIAALRAFEEAGMIGAILTPHFMADYGNNRRRTIERRFAELKRQWEEHTENMPIRLAAEYMIDDRFSSHLSEGLLALDRNSGCVLVESSYMAAHPKFEDMLYEASLEGYRPIIAHPERYAYATDQTYSSWRRRGYLFQLNLMSLVGAYGEMAQEKALALLDKGVYSYAGSDLHNLAFWKHHVGGVELQSHQIDTLRKLYDNNTSLFC